MRVANGRYLEKNISGHWQNPWKRQLLEEEYKYVSLFHATTLFLYPLKTLENQRFSDAINGYRKRPVALNRLIQKAVLLQK